MAQLNLLVAWVAVFICGSNSWDYKENGPDKWATLYPQFCAGEKQTPIHLLAKESRQDTLIKKFVFDQTYSADQFDLTLLNDGHSLKLTWPNATSVKMGLSSDRLTHTAVQMHWHWGANSERGSEHTMEGKAYAAEGHLVFYNSRDYPDFASAADKSNGLAVLGVFYQVSQRENSLFNFLNRALGNSSIIPEKGTTGLQVSKAEFNIFNLFVPPNTDEFYRYEGSLTTPKCFESVLWTVFRETVPISERQLNQLRQLKFPDNSPMVDNFRPPQRLNPGGRASTPRTVYRTFGGASGAAGIVPSLPLVASATVAMLAHLTGFY